MILEALPYDLTVCKIESTAQVNLKSDFFFLEKTDEELSLVCKTIETPALTLAREDGWRGLRITGVLDFSLIGILSRLTTVLASAHIGVFAVSTYNTDYILIKSGDFERAVEALTRAGYAFPGNACASKAIPDD
ncbi:MAG: ACT domain-containing protein [Clostridia bacterium]|nr:ACT domain-containing protein [Clostridia bacterium]